MEERKITDFERNLLSKKRRIAYSINDIDIMTGSEFENFVAMLFNKMGYDSKVTKSTGDQGIDVVCKKGEVMVGIQTKCYSNKVGNSSVQEVVAGIKYYNCNKGMVVANNYFTESAIELAKANDIVLWDRNMLITKINELLQV
jgi:HJR/Mrr/RecB family endonuclease